MKQYLVIYDIYCAKRAYHVRKLVYSYAISGQKSALEVYDEVMLFGKADKLSYDKGVIIVWR